MPHIIGLAVAVEPVVWAAAWCIGQASAGVAANPAAAAMAKVSFLMVFLRNDLGQVRAFSGFRQIPMW
jgi:hypothetical protein